MKGRSRWDSEDGGTGRRPRATKPLTATLVAGILALGFSSLLLVAPVQPAHAESLGTWNQTTTYIGVAGLSCVTYGGFVYCVGGNTPQMGAISAAYYAPLSASGIGTWTQTTSYPQQGSPACVASGGYIYCAGPNPNSDQTTPVYYAPISAAGIGTWTNTTRFPSVTVSPPIPPSYTSPLAIDSCAATASYIYCVGTPSSAGFQYGQAPPDLVYYAPISSSGIGVWTQTTTYPAFLQGQKCIVVPSAMNGTGFVYCIGGAVPPYDGETLTFASGMVEYAPITQSGALGAWTNSTSYPLDITGQSCIGSGVYIYCIAGGVFVDGGAPTNGPKNDVYYTQVNPQGGVSGWTRTTNYPLNDTTLSCVADSGNVYCVGGQIASFGATGAAYYASISTVSPPQPTSQLTVNTQDTNGNPIAGYYTALYDSSGNSVATGFSPAAFTLDSGQSYTVQADDYGSCHFDHWSDTGSTNPQRTVSITSDTVVTGVYACVTSTLSISTTASGGAAITGYYTTLSLSDGTFVGSCSSPCSFTVDNGQNYVVTVANYAAETFTSWSDGDGLLYPWGGSHYVVVPNTATSTTISLTASYTP